MDVEGRRGLGGELRRWRWSGGFAEISRQSGRLAGSFLARSMSREELRRSRTRGGRERAYFE